MLKEIIVANVNSRLTKMVNKLIPHKIIAPAKPLNAKYKNEKLTE